MFRSKAPCFSDKVTNAQYNIGIILKINVLYWQHNYNILIGNKQKECCLNALLCQDTSKDDEEI